jgi:hypothetical protein
MMERTAHVNVVVCWMFWNNIRVLLGDDEIEG